MKKILLILSMVAIFSIPAICQNAYELKVNWNDPVCNCLGTDQDNYFKVTISIYDVVNSAWVVVNKTVNTSDAVNNWAIVPVGEVEDYCDEALQNPSFTVYATVILMETYYTPHVECCDGQRAYTGISCQEIANGEDLTPYITLN